MKPEEWGKTLTNGARNGIAPKDVIRAAMAQAWEEGFAACSSNTHPHPKVGMAQIPLGHGYSITFPANPYEITPAGGKE